MLGVDERVRIGDAQLGKQLSVGAAAVRVAEDELAPPRGELRIVAPERGAVTRRDELVVPLEVDERVPPVEEDRLQHGRLRYSRGSQAPLGIAPPRTAHRRGRQARARRRVTLFVLAALSLIPLAWLIGEATEHAAEHTGPGIGGFLNASFGNAPELIVALFAISANLPVVVRGSLVGQRHLEPPARVRRHADRRAGREARSTAARCSCRSASSAVAVVAFVIPAVVGYTGDPERHAAVVASVPVAIVLLLLYLRRRRTEPAAATGSVDRKPAHPDAWTMPVAARRAHGCDRRDRVGERDPRPLAPRLREHASA